MRRARVNDWREWWDMREGASTCDAEECLEMWENVGGVRF